MIRTEKMGKIRYSLIRFFTGMLTACVICAFCAMAHADEPQPVGTFGQWAVYRMKDQGADVCYMVMTPGISSNAPAITEKKSGQPYGRNYIMVTERPAEHSFDVVSYAAGVILRRNGTVTATVDSKKFTLFADGSFAWNKDSSGDRALTAALRAGHSLKIDAEAARSRKIHESYALKGTSAAYKAMTASCGISGHSH